MTCLSVPTAYIYQLLASQQKWAALPEVSITQQDLAEENYDTRRAAAPRFPLPQLNLCNQRINDDYRSRRFLRC